MKLHNISRSCSLLPAGWFRVDEESAGLGYLSEADREVEQIDDDD